MFEDGYLVQGSSVVFLSPVWADCQSALQVQVCRFSCSSGVNMLQAVVDTLL